MVIRRSLILLSVTIVCLLGVTACGRPETQSQAGTGASSSALPAATASNQAQSSGEGVTGGPSAALPAATASGQVQSSDKGVVVAATPMSATELAAQPKGQSGPGAGAAGGGSQTDPGAQGGQPQQGTMLAYTENTYKFSVSYPANFVARAQPAEKLAQLKPTPAASFTFMNPVSASSDVADLEPADLEIRVYATGQIASLDSWLTSNGLLPSDGSVPLKPFQAANVSGVQVCASTMIAPGCSYFFVGSGRLYQLTPATLAGEAMAKTFTLAS